MKYYIGIDNGVTGTMGIVSETGSTFAEIPIKKEQSYTKAKQEITRVDSNKFFKLMLSYSSNKDLAIAVIERPMVNPTRFKATASGLRCLEAQLVILENLQIPIMYIDSKEWQRTLLPKGIIGTAELKKASREIGKRLYPIHAELIDRHKDADGLLIAHYAKLKNF